MQTESFNRLAHLMKLFQITGKDLADALHVDYTLVSKWRNRKRTFSPRSNYIRRIADYFVTLDAGSSYKRIRKILAGALPELEKESVSTYSALLGQWLTEPEESEPDSAALFVPDNSEYASKSSFTIYTGNPGRREAVLKFLNYALTLPAGQKLLLISQEDMSWLVEDPQFLAEWKQKLVEVIQHRHTIDIIHTVDRDVKELAPILEKWLPLHLSGSIQSRYQPQYADSTLKPTLFIIHGHAAIYGASIVGFSKERYTALHTDAATVAHYENIYSHLFSQCVPLMEKYPLAKPRQLFRKLLEVDSKKGSSYLFAQIPMFFTAPDDGLTDIFSENRISGPDADFCMELKGKASQHFQKNLPSSRLRHIYNLKAMEQAAASGQVPYSDLSVLAAKPVHASRENFLRHIRHLVHLLETYEGFEIALINPPESSPAINIWAKENTAVFASASTPNSMSQFAVSASEPTIANAFYHYYRNIWDSIPRIFRSRDWVIDTLRELMNHNNF